MHEEYITMSTEEISRLEIIQKVIDKRLKQKHAAKILGLSTRQIIRLMKNFRAHGPSALVSKSRGKPSNRRYLQEFKDHITGILKEHYYDFGPTLACEKLEERNGIKLSIETTRQLMIQASLWKAKAEKEKVIHSPRLRRACYGELIQADGSPHDWFEGRGPKCTLIVMIDDATSKIQLLRFFQAETTFAYFKAIRLYIERYGKPIALYVDKLGVFKVNIPDPKDGTGITQFERAMEEIEIEVIHANSPQAKGRVERSNKTLQDRLIKELRLQGISDIEAANKFLDEYMEHHNKKFSVPPIDPVDVHRPLEPINNLDLILLLKVARKINNDLTVRYKNKMYAINVPGKGYRLRQAEVIVCEAESGEITLLHKGQSLSYTVYDKNQQYKEAVSRKELESKLRAIKQNMYKHHSHHKPAANHPWKKQFVERCRLKALREQGLVHPTKHRLMSTIPKLGNDEFIKK